MKLAIIQARMGSTRLPGKVLMEICGKPMLQHIIERVQRTVGLDRVVVATTYLPEDKAINALCDNLGIYCYNGSVDNVMFRFSAAAVAVVAGCLGDQESTSVVRITADCPFVDPYMVSRVIRNHEILDQDYTANIIQPGFPDGFDVECFKLKALFKAYEISSDGPEREHVTTIFRKSGLFSCLSLLPSPRMRQFQNVKLSVDTQEDFDRAKTIYEKIYPSNPDFSAYDVLGVLEKGI